MAVDFNTPTNADAYSDVLTFLNEKIDGVAAMEFAGDTNLPVGTVRYNTTTGSFEAWSGAAWAEVFPLPTNYIGGLITSNDSGDPNHDIGIIPGSCRDSTDVENMRLTSGITKQIDAGWALGDNAGGLDAGAVAANTMYAVWLIKRNDTGVVDALLSTSFTAPTMPANYDRRRLIGAVCTDAGSDITAYIQSGDYFRYMGDVFLDVNDGSITDVTFETGTLRVPPLSLAHIYVQYFCPATTSTQGYVWVKTKGAADDAAVSAESFAGLATSGTFDVIDVAGQVLVDANKQIEYAATEVDGIATVFIHTFGFTMLRRREP